MEKFSKGTTAIARAIAEATKKVPSALSGGGDSVAAITRMALQIRSAMFQQAGCNA